MTDQDYIKAAVELADGWSITIDDQGEMTYFYAPMWVPLATVKEMSTSGVRLNKLSQQMLDALAAQLVRQVDALPNTGLFVEPTCVKIGEKISPGKETILIGAKEIYGSDRTMNTIKAIVDSGVLK